MAALINLPDFTLKMQKLFFCEPNLKGPSMGRGEWPIDNGTFKPFDWVSRAKNSDCLSISEKKNWRYLYF